MKIKSQNLNWEDNLYIGLTPDRYYVPFSYIPDSLGSYACLVIKNTTKSGEKATIVYGTFTLNHSKKLIIPYDIPMYIRSILIKHFKGT
jgi:hypothetical protein